MPTNDPRTYQTETKAYIRVANVASSGATCPFYIPTFFQIEGTAAAVAVVEGQGSAFAIFEILP
jgi:hypothetical protein